MNKKIFVLVVTLLICLSSILIISDEVNVKASEGGGEGESGGIGLDNDFVWNVTEELSNVIINAYDEDDIRKGRAFGTKGDRYAQNLTVDYMEQDCNLTGVTKLPIGYLSDYPEKGYSSKVVINDYGLSISHPIATYPYPNPMPTSELFVHPSIRAHEEWGPTYTWQFNDAKVYDLAQFQEILGENYPFGGTYNGYHLNITYQPLNNDQLEDILDTFIVGNASYIASEDNIPENQVGKVFLIEEEPGCQDKLDNVTNAIGCVLINHNTRGHIIHNASQYSFSVCRTNMSDNEENLTTIINMLENGEIMVADNMVTQNIMTFTYNLEQGDNLPSNGYYTFLCRIRAPTTFYNPLLVAWMGDGVRQYWDWLVAAKIGEIFWEVNKYTNAQCIGTILYDHTCTHFMGTPIKGLPMFSVNNSVGTWMRDHIGLFRPKVSGFLDQEFKEETEDHPGVEAYNVVGYRNISQSPDDEIVVISNRIDGMWGQTPGDSGVGGAIVIGIAKYFNDFDITPKYNLTFLMTTGEEYGFRGAKHFVDSHPESETKYKYQTWIGADQLAFDQVGTNLSICCNDPEYMEIVETIAEETRYFERNGEKYGLDITEAGTRSEDYIWQDRSKTICIVKDNTSRWDLWHRTGMNYTEGDVLEHTDRNDVNLTFEILWNITKYFCVNPDCWFTNVSFEPIDTPNDGDTLVDSIKATFEINTIIPHDKVRVWADIIQYVDDTGDTINYTKYNDYTITYPSVEKTWILPIPDLISHGNCSVQLKLMNSTGRIDYIATLGGTVNYNDTTARSDYYHLYHPFGYINKGSLYKSVEDNITGSIFTANENGYADNITAYINLAFMSPGPYKCMLYRANDSKLIGNTTEDWTPRDDENPACSSGWAVFPFSEPKPSLVQGTQYIISCWGEDSYSWLSYDDFSFSRGRYNETNYTSEPPDYPVFTNESRLYSIYCSYTAENFGPIITSVTSNPDVVGFGFDVTISANVSDVDGVDTVKVNIVKPQAFGEAMGYTMTNIVGDTYEYVFNDTWQNGQYNYTIYAVDNNSNSNTSSQYSFNVSAQANITVCTIKDSYGNEEIVNVTDPPGRRPSSIGYELLDNDTVLHMWNRFDSYYFNTSSGIQLTNHYNEYWSHNVLMLGYYSNDEWNLIYRTDQLSGFNKDIESDDETYVNATLWKDLNYEGYDFRLAIRYHLGVDDNELTIIPYIKNIDDEDIPYTLGFAWEINNIQIDMTFENDYIEINRTTYDLDGTLDLTFKNMTRPIYCWDNITNETYICGYQPIPYFYIREDLSESTSESLYLRWDPSLDYVVRVKSRNGQYNAPVTLAFKIGTLSVGQEKYTELLWYDASKVTYYFDSYNPFGETWSTSPGNMVDGSTATFASTSTGGDVELCTGNSIPPKTDLGTISKVELRAYGYYSNSQRTIILRPVFSGSQDGNNHHFQTTTTAGWSLWFDITRDNNAPEEWRWRDVETLDCDVEDDPSQGDYQFTLYCSKVEVRVTYTSDTAPDISDPYPEDGSTGISLTPVLNISVSDPNGDSMNITWLSNSSGSWVVFGWNNSVNNGTYHQTFANATENGQWWYWKVNVTDGEETVESSVYKFYTGNQSKIVNTGSTGIKGYLLMQVQYFLEEKEWVVAHDTVDETSPRTIKWDDPQGQEGQNILALDTIFNGLVNTDDLSEFGSGMYRIYAAFRDPYGNILKCDDETELVATYEFDITFE